MKKSTIAVIAIIAALAAAVAVLFLLNWGSIQGRQQLLEDGELHLTHHTTSETFVITVADIEALNPQPLQAILRGGGQPGVDVEFYAVPFAALMQAFIPIQDDVDYTVVFTAADGFATAMPQSEAMHTAYIALCAERGPFRLILPYDQFAQRWVHWLTGIELRL
ncbi:MAG: hypothetical protein FWD06_05745 [Oscillospiraceae bacterium]|nr:hypothetical protein [Oscillospiraceae bacterium]